MSSPKDRKPRAGGNPNDARVARLAAQEDKKAHGTEKADKQLIMQTKAVNNYVAGMSQRQALLDAGYSASTSHAYSSQFFARPDIKALLGDRLKDMTKRSKITEDLITQQLYQILVANIGEAVEVSDDGLSAVLNYGKMSPETLASISALDISEDKVGRGDSKNKQVKTKIRMNDKLKAIETAMKLLGLGKEVVEVHGAQENIRQLVEGRNRIIAMQGDDDDGDAS